MIFSVLLLAAAVSAQPSALTAEQIKAAQTIVSDTCNVCHADKKPLTARLLQEESPARKTGHFKKKAELTDDQIKLMVQYLNAVRDGLADLPKTSGTSGKAVSSSKTEKAKPQGKREKREDEDDDDDEHEHRGRSR